MRIFRTMLFLLVLYAARTAAASGQDVVTDGVEWSSEVRVLGVNALIGGASAGLVALLRGETPGEAGRAIARGAAGGALVYAGKRVVVERWFGAGLIGRQVGLLGGSVVRNAGAGRGSFDRVAFGFGPIRGYAGAGTDGVEWSLDLPAAAAAALGFLGSSHDFDPALSVSSGALVFTGGANFPRRQDRVVNGAAMPGTVFYTRSSRLDRQEYVLAHERVHVLHYDQTFLAWGDPFESWLGRRIPALEAPLRHLEFNLVGLGAAVLLSIYAWPLHEDQPWEQEATYLGRSR